MESIYGIITRPEKLFDFQKDITDFYFSFALKKSPFVSTRVLLPPYHSGSGVIVKTMVCFRIDVSGEFFFIFFKGGFISWPTFIDARIKFSIMQKQRSLDLGTSSAAGWPP